MTAPSDSIHEGCILTGSLFNEPMRVETVRTGNDGTWTVGLVGTHTERFRKVTLTKQDIKGLTILDSGFTFDGDGHLLRLGLQAYSLGIAWNSIIFGLIQGRPGCLMLEPSTLLLNGAFRPAAARAGRKTICRLLP